MERVMGSKSQQDERRVLVVSHGIGRGGAQRVTAMIGNGLFNKGYRVRIVTTAPSESIFDIQKGIDYFPVVAHQKHSLLRTLYRIIILRKNILDFKPNYIIALSAIPNMLTIIARGLKKIDIVVSERTDPSKYPQNKIAVLLRNYLYRIPKAIVFQTDEAKRYFNVSIQKKGIIIPNAVPPGLPEPYFDERDKVIVGVGALSEQKDWMTGVKAFELLIRKHPEFKLIIYGEGSCRKEIESYLAGNSELKERVLLPGFTDDVYQKMRRAMLLISSAAYDGISNSILEAMAMGIPCVCTDAPVGGARMLVRNNENGILVPVGDYEAMYLAMENIIEQKDLARKMGVNAVRVRQLYKFDTIIDMWEKVMLLKEK